MLTPADREYLAKKKIELVDNCPKCHGRSSNCDCAKRFSLEYAKIRANIPEAYREFTLDQLIHPELQEQKVELEKYTKKFIEGTASDLLIAGSSGTAKSSVAAYLLTEALKMRKSGYFFYSIRTVKDIISSTWDKNAPVDPLLQTLKTSDCIVIDNFNSGLGIPDFMKAYIVETLDTRRLYGKRTILVANGTTNAIDSDSKEIISHLKLTKIQLTGFNYKDKVVKATKGKKNARK